MISRFLGLILIVLCITISILRGTGVLEGDFIIPLILLSQLFILGYIIQLVQIIARDIVVRYTRNNKGPETTTLHTWN